MKNTFKFLRKSVKFNYGILLSKKKKYFNAIHCFGF